jgi:hypothetical protein
MKIVVDFEEFPPPSCERSTSSSTSDSTESIMERKSYKDFVEVPAASFYLSPIEENSEASSSSSRSRRGENKRVYPPSVKEEESLRTKNIKDENDYYSSRKYHTYPKSRIPVLKTSSERKLKNLMDPRMYPLEPREIDFEAFQQLHTANSQEELQEFLLLESQCSGTIGLAGNISGSEIYYHDDKSSDDERGAMSGISRLQNNIIAFLVFDFHTNWV